MSVQVNLPVPSNGVVNVSLKSVGTLGALNIFELVEIVVIVAGKSDASSHTESDFVVPYSLPRDNEKQSWIEPVFTHSNR